jgi:hypothetical protein
MIELQTELNDLSFNCLRKWSNGRKETWTGRIVKFKIHVNFIEFLIMSRSSLYVICGKGERGYWACVPDYFAGCDLSMRLNDTFYNTEKLFVATKNKVDAITIAEALKTLDLSCILKS